MKREPRVAVVGIGDELLAGFTVNGNGAFIARTLFEAGFAVSEQRMISDTPEELQRALRELMKVYDLVICTGGLGPTLDDNTRTTVAAMLEMPLEFNAEVASLLGEGSTVRDQATIPAGARPLPNSVGTAPGLIFEEEECTLILLPGVPLEMEMLMTQQVMPYIRSQFASLQGELDTLHFFHIPEAEVDGHLRKLQERHPQVGMGIYPRLGVVNVRLMANTRAVLAPVRAALLESLGGWAFDGDTLEEAVHEICVAKGLTLTTAASCTGGAIASALTTRPGASNYFVGSVVSYSDAIKEKILHVSPETLREFGAVSRQVVEEMVSGLLDLTGSDLGVAVSGIAGPSGGSLEKPVGTVWVAVARRGEPPVVSHFVGHGNRQAVIRRTVNWALAEVYQLLNTD